jgi:hypothetical protein
MPTFGDNSEHKKAGEDSFSPALTDLALFNLFPGGLL